MLSRQPRGVSPPRQVALHPRPFRGARSPPQRTHRCSLCTACDGRKGALRRLWVGSSCRGLTSNPRKPKAQRSGSADLRSHLTRVWAAELRGGSPCPRTETWAARPAHTPVVCSAEGGLPLTEGLRVSRACWRVLACAVVSVLAPADCVCEQRQSRGRGGHGWLSEGSGCKLCFLTGSALRATGWRPRCRAGGALGAVPRPSYQERACPQARVPEAALAAALCGDRRTATLEIF